jgi:hypothetical protein
MDDSNNKKSLVSIQLEDIIMKGFYFYNGFLTVAMPLESTIEEIMDMVEFYHRIGVSLEMEVY